LIFNFSIKSNEFEVNIYLGPVMKGEPDVVPEEGRHADGEENGYKEEEDDMILGDPQRGDVHPEVDEVFYGGARDEGTVEQSVAQEQHKKLKY
jgi:hypothetical protein